MEQKGKRRYEYLDTLRGITLISMILYHAVWNLVYFAGLDWGWFRSQIGYVWQQSICWTFILLSGFCWSMGKRRLQRAATVLGAGALVTAVTLVFTPQQRIIFGVLSFLGVSMLLMIPLDRIFVRIPAGAGLGISFGLFFLLKEINEGSLGFGPLKLAGLPDSLYDMGLGGTFLGFTDRAFYSADYFSLLPWFFLFTAGYFLYGVLRKRELLCVLSGLKFGRSPFAFLGRHSLLIYLAHQPVLYLGVLLLG